MPSSKAFVYEIYYYNLRGRAQRSRSKRTANLNLRVFCERKYLASWTNFSYQDKTWAEFSSLD